MRSAIALLSAIAALLLLVGCTTDTDPRRDIDAGEVSQLDADFEFEPYPGSQWYAPDGAPIPRESGAINAITGPDHCDWESAVMLHVGSPLGDQAADSSELRQYLRDPEGVFTDDMLLTTFDANVDLPSKAQYTGYRTDFMELWLEPESQDAAHLVFADHVERWPRARQVIACA